MKLSLFILVLALTFSSAPFLFAQDAGSDSSLAARAPATGGNTPRGEKIKQVLAKLDLTDAQKQQMQQIFANSQPGQARRQQIMAVLTPDQKQKLLGIMKDYRSVQAGQ